MRKITIAACIALISAAAGCAGSSVRAARVASPTLAVLPEGAPRAPLAWADLDAATLARAKAEKKYIVLDGSAEWCHWCHVMEATTYHDEAVRTLLERHFIAVKVDVDARPDIEERYGDYGWPATVIFAPDASELGKYRGYIPPAKFAAILQEVVRSKVAENGTAWTAPKKPALPRDLGPMSEEQIAWIAHMVDVELDEYWDEKQGGWGRTQKAPLAWDNAWALDRARGNDEWKRRALFTLDQQSKIIDPVWGGIYQYSASTDWDHAHFEKLMPFQAGALDNYAQAYILMRDEKYLRHARKMQGYIEAFLMSREGGFYVSQDADLNAHDPGKPFMNGHDYYPMDDARRRAAGIPRVDDHEYGKENGLAIAAYATLYEATNDERVLATAKRAATRILATHASSRGGISHDARTGGATADQPGEARVLHLGDNAAFGFALMRLHDVTKTPEHLETARRIADFMLREMDDKDGGGFFASTVDPDAVGVFSTRRTPFEENVMAIRFLAKLAKADPPKASPYTRAIARTIATPEEIKSRGRMLGDFLLALEETRGVR